MGKPFHLAGLGILLAFMSGCGGKEKTPTPPPPSGGGVPPGAVGFSGFLEDPNPGTPLYTLYRQNPDAYADSMRNLEQTLNDSGDFVPQTSLDVMYSTQEQSGRRAILQRYNPSQNQFYQPRRQRIEGVISSDRYGLSLDSENYDFVYELPGYSDAMKRPIESTDAVALFVSPAGGDDPREVIKFFYRNAGSHPLYSYLLEPGGGYSPRPVPTGQPTSFDWAPSPWTVSAHGHALSMEERRRSSPRPEPPTGWRTGSLHVIQTTGTATFYGGNRNFRR